MPMTPTDPPLLTPEEVIELIRRAVASVKHDDYADGGRATHCSSCGDNWGDEHNCVFGLLENTAAIIEALRVNVTRLQRDLSAAQAQVAECRLTNYGRDR